MHAGMAAALGGRSNGTKNVAKWPYGSLLTGRKGRCYSGLCT